MPMPPDPNDNKLMNKRVRTRDRSTVILSYVPSNSAKSGETRKAWTHWA